MVVIFYIQHTQMITASFLRKKKAVVEALKILDEFSFFLWGQKNSLVFGNRSGEKSFITLLPS